MKALYLYLKSHPKLAALGLGVLLVASAAIALEVQWIFHSLATLNSSSRSGQSQSGQSQNGQSENRQSKLNQADALSAALTMAEGLQPANAMANNPLAADPKIAVIMAQFHLGAKAAGYIAQAKFEVVSQNDTSIHFVATFPDKIIIDQTATIALRTNRREGSRREAYAHQARSEKVVVHPAIPRALQRHVLGTAREAAAG